MKGDAPVSERRQVILVVDEDVILALLQGAPVGRLSGIPGDAIIDAVHYDPTFRAFMFRVSSAEFEPVPRCTELPRIIAEFTPSPIDTDNEDFAKRQANFFFPPGS